MTTSEITIKVNSIDLLLIGPDSIFYGRHMLTREAEELIIEEATIKDSGNPILVKIFFNNNETERSGEISNAIHKHFASRRKKSERELKKSLALGWRSLLISIIFLALLIWLTSAFIDRLPEGGWLATFREILIILGWVALWRPADLLLYEWRPFKREVNLFRRLEACKVEIVTNPAQ